MVQKKKKNSQPIHKNIKAYKVEIVKEKTVIGKKKIVNWSELIPTQILILVLKIPM